MATATAAYDVAVIGGGTAGVPAAVQAAKAGARTILIEKNGILGGTLTVGGVAYPGIFHARGKQVIAGIGWNLVEECVRLCGLTLPDFSAPPERHFMHQVRVKPAIYAMLCDEAAGEAGVELRLHTMLAELCAEEKGWRMRLCGKEGLSEISAGAIVDCTGDANAVALAGLPVNIPEERQPGTLICRAAGYDFNALDMQGIDEAFRREIAEGRLRPEDGGWDTKNPSLSRWLSCCGGNTGHVHALDAQTSAGKTEMELNSRRTLLQLFRFMRAQPGLEKLSIDVLMNECGIRETVTIVGEETITADDYTSGRVWEDSICHAFYPIDLHKAGGSGLDCRPLAEGVVPTIPLRALLPKGSKRIAAAGRCVSSDRLANSALRVQASSMAMGQAAGGWAALCAKNEDGQVDFNALASLLRQHGAIVPQAG